jgi:D-glutamate N-acetyltransferase
MNGPTYLIIAEGAFSPETSKTANSALRYLPERIVGVLDSTAKGATCQDVLGYGGSIPVVRTIEEGFALQPQALMIGIAPAGGRLPPEWRGWILAAFDRGLSIWSGLHTSLGDDPEFAARARARGVTITDARKPPANLPVSNGLAKDVDALVVLSVGSDCNVGKMTAQLQIVRGLNARGVRTRFAATGQTGILIEGWGIAVDAVVADFIGGAAEQLVLEAAIGADVVLVEGQGSLIHPGYSGVTLGLLHGSCPSAMLLCHQASRDLIGDYSPTRPAWVRIPPLAELVRVYEDAARPVHESKVVGIALNTYDLSDAAARAAIKAAQEETGLPATDPVRYDPAPLIDAVAAAHAGWKARRVTA